MDASAYLRKQGWRGEGHSLDHSNRGIRKPLLVSKKVDVLGVGLNKHTSVSDQWWLRAFDEGLRNLGTGQESALAQVQKHGVHRAGLYANFVRGQKLEGSIGSSALPTPSSTAGTNTPVRTEHSSAERTGEDAGTSSDDTPHDSTDTSARMTAAGKKIKRESKERPKEIRARRKIERREKQRMARANAPVDPRREEIEIERRKIDRRVREFVVEAQRRGLLPANGNSRSGPYAHPDPDTFGANFDAVNSQDLAPEVQQVFEQAGLFNEFKQLGKQPLTKQKSVKAQKYDRERKKRELKRAARAYVMSEVPREVTERDKIYEKERRAARRQKVEQAKAETDAKEAEKRASKAAHRLRKREKKARKRAEKEMWANIPPEKLAQYQQRANQKGMDLARYVLRRKEKTVAKRA